MKRNTKRSFRHPRKPKAYKDTPESSPQILPEWEMRLFVILASLAFVASPMALSGQELERPADWKLRLDRPDGDPAEVYFVHMPPGWHVTTGPATILYDPSSSGSGEYRLEAEIFLFDPVGRREGFGVFLGGKDLEGSGQAYTYFLIREGGQFLVKSRAGDRTPTLVDWTPHAAIRSWVERGEGEETAKNVLAVDVGGDEVVFSVNGEEVTRLPRSRVDADGVVGLRVNHSLDLHVSRLDLRSRDGA
jgi:hypothetical protein